MRASDGAILMRISADKTSPFFVGALLEGIQVYWEGIRLEGCVEASEEEGWADCVARDDAGKTITEPCTSRPCEFRVKIVRHTGRVHIAVMAVGL